VLAGPFGRVIPKARQAKMGTPWATDLEQLAVDNGQTPPLKVFAPRRGDQTGDAPLPATPYPRTRLLARIPGSIRAGFQTKHNLGRFGEEP